MALTRLVILKEDMKRAEIEQTMVRIRLGNWKIQQTAFGSEELAGGN